MWIHIPEASTSYPSAPEAAGSISASDWRCQALEASAWWRGKPSDARTWSRRCERVSFMRLLCGQMPEPSTAARGVAAWTASLAASRASRTAWPDEKADRPTRATCGARPGASSCRPAAGSCSSRTSAACCRPGLTKSLEPSGFAETFASWALRLREDSSRRRRLARRTSASGCSSSASMTGWPTPEARDWKGASDSLHDRGSKGAPLNEIAKVWPTPASANAKQGSEDPEAKRKRSSKSGLMLTDVAVALRGTPRASDGEKGGPNQAFGAGGMPLPAQASQWATPNVPNGGRSNAVGSLSPTGLRPDGSRGQVDLNFQVTKLFSLPAPATSTPGATSSPEPRSLNPLFVEWLMGWPPEWVRVSTSSGCSATALCRWWLDMRCALLAMPLPAPAPAAQHDLFG